MASLDFPASPTTGQIFVGGNGVSYQYNGTLWLATGSSAGGDFFATFAGTWPAAAATIIFPTVVVGNEGSYYNVANGRWTPPVGRYCVYSGVSGSTASGAATNSVTLRKNGTAVVSSTDTVAAANLWAQPSLNATVDANGTDFFDIQCAGTAWDRAGTTAWFGAYPISGIKGPPGDATPGTLIQTVSFETGAVATGTTVIPQDDTIPQITEGNEYMTLAITPRSATSRLIIEVVCTLSSSVINTLIMALFQDATANALAAEVLYAASVSGTYHLTLRHTMISGTTSATTFRVRAGGAAAGTTTFNGSAGARYFGGVLASSIVIQEVAP